MSTDTSNCRLDWVDESAPTGQRVYSDMYRLPRYRATWAKVPVALLAIGILTTPVSWDDKEVILANASLSRQLVTRKRKIRKISLAEAWLQVRQVFDEAEKLRSRQRDLDGREISWDFGDSTQ